MISPHGRCTGRARGSPQSMASTDRHREVDQATDSPRFCPGRFTMPAFSLVSWLKQQLDGHAWKHRRRRHFFQPRLTVLEDRVAPAAFTVNTFSDTNVKDFTTGTDA